MLSPECQAIMDQILAANRSSANRLIDEWVAEHGYENTVETLLEPVLHAIGEMWVAGENSLAQAYIASKVVEDTMTKAALVETDKGRPRQTRGPVIMANIEDDYHSLGRKLVCTFLRSDGWEVIDLGNDMPAADLVDQAQSCRARVIGVSAMMYTTAMNIKKLRQEIDQRGLTGKIQLAVGGAVFVEYPELVQEVGGDGTARNAIQASALMDELWARAESESSR